MRFDFSDFPIGNRAFSERPMTFCDPAAVSFLSAIMEIAALETGNRRARDHWQKVQLRNLLLHATQRSAFWRQRIGTRKAGDIKLASLPVLTRQQLREQVEKEGALFAASDPIRVTKLSTSGSSGVPVAFSVSEMNTRYTQIRSTAQYFLEGRDLTLNRTRIFYSPVAHKKGFTVETTDSWLGPLASFIAGGKNKHIEYFHPNAQALRAELARDPIGYLVAAPETVETLFNYFDPIFFKQAGTAMFIPLSGSADRKLRDIFAALEIPVRANYSSEEVGMIGAECIAIPGNYHVATSNVIVEIASDELLHLGDRRLGRVLVTHLHSYATPFIRYDIGDLAALSERCGCGHDGPTLSHMYGRAKELLKHADGHVSVFHVSAHEMARIARFDEYRIRQTDVATIIVEIGGRDSLTAEETAAIAALILTHAGAGFDVVVKPVAKIDWASNVKRLGFHSEIL